MKEKNSIQEYPRVLIDFLPRFPALKVQKDKTLINVRYSLIAPFAYAHIYWNPKISEVVYEIEEPILDDDEKEIKNKIISAMRDLINYDTIVEKDTNALLEYIDQGSELLQLNSGSIFHMKASERFIIICVGIF
ncbi:MAG: hypothetical protein Q7S56_04110 [Nanoarchaeota archaeon]|nr:hypothetical protein [Nanoarchaeota archaeon]